MSKKIANEPSARRFIIDDMKPLEVSFNASTGEAEYSVVKSMGQGIYPDYPVLIQSNGLPWTLGNLYLLKRLEDSPKYEPKTWQNLSTDLLHFLRWLEHTGTNPLHFHPLQRFNRPTYKYRAHLIDLCNEEVIKPSTASGRMSTIINFYRGLVEYNILSSDVIELAWKEKQVLIQVIGKDLVSKKHAITTTDLAIKRQPKTLSDDFIRDEGNLIPLARDEQEVLFRHLRSSTMSLRLLFTTAVLTGARVQTLCTLRGETLEKAIHDKEQNRYLLNVGGANRLVDTKKGKHLIVVMPDKLYSLLVQYWNSPESVSRRVRSFYGNTPQNYLFLNADAMPYITSKQEKLDRRNPEINKRVSLDGGIAKSRNGQAIWTFINGTLLPRIRKEIPDFKTLRFHDLRATFGMNLLETLLKSVDSHNAKIKAEGRSDVIGSKWVLEQIKERLGHSDMSTTMGYLNYRRNHEFKANLQIKVEDELMKYASAESITYDE